MFVVKIRDVIALVAFLLLLVQSSITYHLNYYENEDNMYTVENSYKEPHIITISAYTLLVIFSILTIYINNFEDNNNVYYHSIY